MHVKWKVFFSGRAKKQAFKLKESLRLVLQLLVDDLENKGPILGKNWQNYSKLRGSKSEDKRHCHLIKGNPTYVCCWKVLDKKQRVIEVYYVGSHEKAPY